MSIYRERKKASNTTTSADPSGSGFWPPEEQGGTLPLFVEATQSAVLRDGRCRTLTQLPKSPTTRVHTLQSCHVGALSKTARVLVLQPRGLRELAGGLRGDSDGACPTTAQPGTPSLQPPRLGAENPARPARASGLRRGEWGGFQTAGVWGSGLQHREQHECDDTPEELARHRHRVCRITSSVTSQRRPSPREGISFSCDVLMSP